MSLCVCELPAHPRIGRLGRAQQFVGADRQRFGEAGQMVEGEPALARLEPAERGHVDARAAGHVLERQAALNASVRAAAVEPAGRHRSQAPSLPAWQITLADPCTARQAGGMNETQAHWEEHYGERDRVWSGRVNVQFADVVADLPPGRALDLGCGEGADAVWLAERGWNVVAVDISETALGRAREAASSRGVSRPHRVRSARPVRRLSRRHVRP